MSLAVSFSPPAAGTAGGLRSTTLLCKPPAVGRQFSLPHSKIGPAAIAAAAASWRLQRKPLFMAAKAIQQSRDTAGSESESQPDQPPAKGGGDTEVEQSALGAEIKAAMEERKSAAVAEEKGRDDLLSGVVDEVREIEWPAFQKVLGTTGVVLGVIAGSSVVLLTVNLILAELSDRAFAGKGVQDFFS